MSELKFYGPYHFDDIDNIDYSTGNILADRKNVQKSEKKPGIYIWGFMYNLKNGELLDALEKNIEYNRDTMQFIPYYVGEKTNNLFARIKQHNDIIGHRGYSDGLKYLRLAPYYMKEYFKDDDFPIRNPGNKVKEHLYLVTVKKAFGYHNNKKILMAIYPSMIPVTDRTGNQPINIQSNCEKNLPDILAHLIIESNNFWFYYAPKIGSRNELESFETSVFYSLKGKTISKTQPFNKINPSHVIIGDDKIFKKKDGRIIQTESFQGY